MREILHICDAAAWAGTDGELYETASLADEGFIHCSTRDQVLTPANSLFRGRQGLILLVIDERRVTAPVVYEDCYTSGIEFPHIYGALNIDAVLRVVEFPSRPDGAFALPDEL